MIALSIKSATPLLGMMTGRDLGRGAGKGLKMV
jgi:hypothetical protein